jgi:hypothetical protein
MDVVSLLREQLKQAHQLLEDTMADVTPEQLHYAPQGRALPIGAAYAHVIFTEDITVQQLLKKETPLFEAGTDSGASEPMPNFAKGDWDGYEAWTRRVRFDLPRLRAYGARVYAASDAYLASLTESDLDQDVPFFQSSLAHMIGRGLIGHADNLTGEISAVKGVQGLKGYPF